MSEVDEVAEAVGRLLRDRCTQEVVAAAEGSGWAPELWAALAEGGYPWVSVPERSGGVGGSVAQACAVLEQVGRHAAPLPVAETTLLASHLLTSAGLEIPPDAPVTTAPVIQSLQPGGSVGSGGVLLRRTASGWRVSGEVARVPWARAAARIALLATDRAGERYVVSLEPDAAEIRPGTNLAGEPRDTVVLRDAPVAELAPTEVTSDALGLRGALSRAALIAGAGGRVLDITVAYTNDRVQFGRPVARFQAVAAHLVRLAEQVEAARMAARVAALNQRFVDVAAAKTVASEAAGLIAAAAHQATGAMGMTREYELGQLTRRLWSWREEYGGERLWSTRLGAHLAAEGADRLWPTIAAGVVA